MTNTDLSLSQDALLVFSISQALAKENMNPQFSPSHVLKALIHKDVGLQGILKQLDKDIYYIEEWADVRIESLAKTTTIKDTITADKMVEEVVNEADNIRLKFLSDNVQPVHLLAAICTPGVGFTYEQLKTLPLRREEILQGFQEKEKIQAVLPGKQSMNGASQKKTQALMNFCKDKTLEAKEGRVDKIIGRDKELRMMCEILCRRSKPNVLIVGEPGVGKSSMIDAFTQAVLDGKVPGQLANARIFELDAASLIAGASYKGEIEERMKNILAEIKQFDKAILFIDEIHALIDKNGAAAGAISMLKPELARGEITIVGATTLDEYRKYIEKDEALNRRFEVLKVEEPDVVSCYHMLKNIMAKYEEHHQMQVPDDTIKESIRLAKRYIKDRKLPDAAIDLADRTMASMRLINDTGETDLEDFKKQFEELIVLEEEESELLEKWQWLQSRMREKLSPILWGSFESDDDPATFRKSAQVRDYTSKALEKLHEAVSIKQSVVAKNDIAAIVSYKTGIPLGKVQTQEKERLLNMESALSTRVIGQGHGIKSIAEAVLESRSGLSKPGQPIGSFFFLGPTGTGKTELAKALASFLFQDESFMIRFDMSEFKEEHSAALLYGAPPGYVGYEEGGLLVNKIREKPYSVVLFDEIEKAHASVFDIFLQILDEGKLHDKLGKEGDFSNAVVIFTSNIGSQHIVDSFNGGVVPTSNALMDIMGKHFRPEFLGRLTEIIPFAPMNEEMVRNILNVQLKGLYASLDKLNIKLGISDAALKSLALLGFNPQYGARPLGGVIRSQIRRPLSRKIISGEVNEGDSIVLDIDTENSFIWSKS